MSPLQQAEANIRAGAGLSDDPTTWSYNERVAYNNALAQWVNMNPTQVSSAELAVAQGDLNSTPLDDDSFTSELSEFTGAVGDNILAAGDKVASIGNGVLNFADMAKWLIPLAGLAVVGILVWGFYKKQA